MAVASVKLRTGSGAFDGARGFGTRFHWDSNALKYIQAIENVGAQIPFSWKSAINDFYITLKENNIWEHLEIFYLFVGGTADTHAVEGKNPNGSYNITWNGTGITHNQYGVKGVGGSTTAYGNTNWNPTTSATVLSQNNASLGICYRTIAVSGLDLGLSNGTSVTNGSGLYIGSFGSGMYGVVNTAVTSGTLNSANLRPGLTSGRRIASGNMQAYKSGYQVLTPNAVSDTLKNLNAYIAAVNFNGTASGSANQINFAFIGDGSVNMRILNSAVTTLQAKLGRAYV